MRLFAPSLGDYAANSLTPNVNFTNRMNNLSTFTSRTRTKLFTLTNVRDFNPNVDSTSLSSVFILPCLISDGSKLPSQASHLQFPNDLPHSCLSLLSMPLSFILPPSNVHILILLTETSCLCSWKFDSLPLLIILVPFTPHLIATIL